MGERLKKCDADQVKEALADGCSAALQTAIRPLLKSIEEPAAATVWILCAPTPDDVVATIRSRCRLLSLQTPSVRAVAELFSLLNTFNPNFEVVEPRRSRG